MVQRLVKTLVGLAVVLAWWTIRGPGDSHSETADHIPSVVWDGGAGSMTIRAETTTPAQMRVSFSENSESDDSRSLQTHEDVPAGSHSWTIQVPADVSGYVELSASSPQPGDRLAWTIEAAGATVDEQSETLEKPLEEGYGFFLQSYFDDYASGELGDG
jgi:hypothetical protein